MMFGFISIGKIAIYDFWFHFYKINSDYDFWLLFYRINSNFDFGCQFYRIKSIMILGFITIG